MPPPFPRLAGAHLPPQPRTAAKYGFVIGVGTAATVGICGAIFWRRLQIRPENVYRHAVRMVTQHPEVQNRLGADSTHFVEPGKLKAFDTCAETPRRVSLGLAPPP